MIQRTRTSLTPAARSEDEEVEIIAISKEDFLQWMEEVGIEAGELAFEQGGNTPAGVQLLRQLREFGWNGRMRFQTYNGKEYVIFGGRPGLRNLFTGTRYLTNNPKVISFAIGEEGLRGLSRVGMIVSLVLVAVEVGTYLLDDDKTLYDVGAVAITGVAKAAIAGAAASLATLAFGATSLVVAPVAAGLAVGILVAWALDELDNRYKITEAISNYFEEQHNAWQDTQREFWRQYWALEDYLRRGGRLPW